MTHIYTCTHKYLNIYIYITFLNYFNCKILIKNNKIEINYERWNNRSNKNFKKRTIEAHDRVLKSRGLESRKRKHTTKAGTEERAKCLIACVPRHREEEDLAIPSSLSLCFFLLFFSHIMINSSRVLPTTITQRRLAFSRVPIVN